MSILIKLGLQLVVHLELHLGCTGRDTLRYLMCEVSCSCGSLLSAVEKDSQCVGCPGASEQLGFGALDARSRRSFHGYGVGDLKALAAMVERWGFTLEKKDGKGSRLQGR